MRGSAEEEKEVGGAVTMTYDEAEALFAEADEDGNQVLDYAEFARVWDAMRGNAEEEKEVRAKFAQIDKDDSGFISKEEMINVISSSNQYLGDSSLLSSAAKIVNCLDMDQDGKVSYPEFLLAWRYR